MEDYFEHHKEMVLSGGGKIIIQGNFNALDLCGLDLHTVKLLLAVIDDHCLRASGQGRNLELAELASL
jgi:hypothetical protein